MHDIEPYYKWRKYYIAAEDKQSIYYGMQYSEFTFTNKTYNYFIHPQWDTIGSPTLYAKVIFLDYEEGYVFIELIGEWNDCLNNDVMFLKRKLVDHLIHLGINKYIILCDNVLEYHGGDDSYYEEWWDDIKDDGGWVILLNTREHILEEMEKLRLQYYVNIDENFSDYNWRKAKPQQVYQEIQQLLFSQSKQLSH